MTGSGRFGTTRHHALARLAATLVVVGSIVSGCLSLDEPSPTPPTVETPPPTMAPSESPRDPAALTVAVPTYPAQLLPPASDESSELLLSLLYDPLYRLDEQLVPRPKLAADLPRVSEDGLTWTIDLAPGDLRFSDGRPVTATDVVGSLKIARSPTCSLGRELCATALDVLESVEEVDDRQVQLTLTEPYAPFLAEVLAQLPILDDKALEAGASGIVRGASGTAASAPDKLVTDVYKAVGSDACLVAQPPTGCDLSDHTPDLERLLTRAGLDLPSRDAFTNDTGQVDEAAYANELLDRVASLGQVLSRSGTDRLAAALPLLDLSARPLGSGAYRISRLDPGVSVELEAVPDHLPAAATIPRVSLKVIADPAVAATRLLSGDVDWVLQTDQEQAATIDAAPGVRAGLRALPGQWTLLFNTRRGRLYADTSVRRAFAACVDRGALIAQVGSGEAIAATTPLAPDSWGMDPVPEAARDVDGANQLLDAAGWVRGSDGIRVREGTRLSSSIAVRASQASLLAFAHSVATELLDCGIELQVQELDLTGDSLFEQLRWPNDFDTLLTMRALGADPDADLQAFESSHATNADQEVDANPGGYRSSTADQLIRRARETADQARRTDLYGRLQGLLTRDVPAWPIWYDTEWSAISERVRGPAGPIDPSVPRFAWDIASWSLLDGTP